MKLIFTALACAIVFESARAQKPLPEELNFSGYSREVQAALDHSDDVELESLLSRGMTSARSDIMKAIRFRPLNVQVHVLEMALADGNLWPVPEIGMGEDIIAQRAFRAAAHKTIATLLPNLPEYDFDKSQDRTFLRQQLAALLSPPRKAMPKETASARAFSDTQSVGDSQTPTDIPKSKSTALSTTALPEVHGPPHLIFWLGVTILSALAAGWLALRSPKRK